VGRDTSEQPLVKKDLPFEVSGQMPKAFKEAMAKKAATAQSHSEDEDDLPPFIRETRAAAPKKQKAADSKIRVTGSDSFEAALSKLSDPNQWEEFEFPSKGRFYTDIPPVVHIRPMTGEEEQILATPRFVKKGKAIDMIFDRCIREKINTEDLLSVDRTHLLIYL